MEQPQRDRLAGPEVRLGVLGHGAQLLIDVVEQGVAKAGGRLRIVLGDVPDDAGEIS